MHGSETCASSLGHGRPSFPSLPVFQHTHEYKLRLVTDFLFPFIAPMCTANYMFLPVYNVVHENFCIAFLPFWISWQRKYLTSLVQKVFVHKALTQFQCHPEVFLLFVTAILETSSLLFGKQLK